MNERRSIAFALAAVALGMAVFVGIRWGAVSAELTPEWPSALWFALPLAASYAGAAAMGMILVRDGVTRWWWLPAVLFVGIGTPVEGWVQGSSFLATRLTPVVGSAVDVLLVLAPAAVLFARARGRRAEIPDRIVGRIVPVVAVSAVCVVLAMLVGQSGPDVSGSVGITLLTFGACSRSSSWGRAVAFVLIAIAVGAQVPGSFEIVVACLCFAIAPLSRAWDHLLIRLAARRVAAEA
jgi:hypothetical protein